MSHVQMFQMHKKWTPAQTLLYISVKPLITALYTVIYSVNLLLLDVYDM